jgi:ABC-type multidrug transport system permease subunit
MIKLLELIKKNFKLLVRAKVSALVIFIGPLLLVSLLGLAYSQSSNFMLTASVYSQEYTELSESLITKMTNQDFLIIKEESIDNCIGSVKRKESQACIIFPPEMEVRDDMTNEITFYVDYSQINLVWLMLDVMSARVSERSEEISKELTDDLLHRMLFVEEKLQVGKSTLTNIKSKGTRIENASSKMQTGFKRLDISVDFSGLDITTAANTSGEIISILNKISSNLSSLSTDIRSEVQSIESSAASIESEVNTSSVLAELNDIDNAADDIQDLIDNSIEGVSDNAANASSQMAQIKTAFESINQKLSETKSKINSVKKQRDDLMPQFDTVSSDIESLMTSITTMQLILDESFHKIVAVQSRSADKIVAPITTRIEPVSTQNTHFNSLFPTLLVLIIMITGIFLAATLVIVEKKSKAFFRNSFTPTSYLTFNLSTYITALIVIFIQLILFVSVSAFFFETEVFASVLLILLLIFLAATVFICIGMFVGFLFRTEETVNLAAITLIAVFLLFSSAVIPLESMPSYLKDIALFNPFVVSELALRQTLIFQFGFAKLAHSLTILVGYAAGIFLLLVIAQNSLRRLSFVHFKKIHFNIPIRKGKKASVDITKPAHSKEKPVSKPSSGKKPFWKRFLKRKQ